METKTIEERALEITKKSYCKEYDCPNYEKNCKYTGALCQEAKDVYNDFVQIATEQDRIARAEERERCIRIAQKVKCKQCDMCDDYRQSDGYCSMLMDIRKAMEGGEG